MSAGLVNANPDHTVQRPSFAGLTTGQRDVLEATRRKGGGTVREITARSGYTRPFVASALALLEERGLVTRTGTRVSGGRPSALWAVA